MTAGDDWSAIVTFGVLGLVGLRLVSALRVSTRRRGRAQVVEIWRGIRWRHVWPVPLVLPVIVVLAGLLVRVPGLDWGWWTAIGGQGNPISGTTDQTVGTVWEWIVPLVFVVLLLPALALFAHAEERMFRTGAEHWTPARRVVMCLKFGAVHALVGVPLGVALALSAGGAYFLAVYLHAVRRGASSGLATLESTRAHLAYNVVIVVLVGLYAVAVALGG